MLQEDLSNLRCFLEQMLPEAPVAIGGFRCSASEMLEVVDDALVRRATRAAERSESAEG